MAKILRFERPFTEHDHPEEGCTVTITWDVAADPDPEPPAPPRWSFTNRRPRLIGLPLTPRRPTDGSE